MIHIVKGKIRGLGQNYSNGVEKLEIQIPLKFANKLPITLNQPVAVSLKIESITFAAGLRSTSNNPYIWISPNLELKDGTERKLTNILLSKGYKKNDDVYLSVNGNKIVLNPRLSRKQFILAEGATCKNWTWSWSFVNEKDKVVIFGAWDQNTTGESSIILSEEWQISRKGKLQPAYKQSREHIRLIEEQGYKLKTFPMTFAWADEDELDNSPAKINGFDFKLSDKFLKRVGSKWYAVSEVESNLFPDEIEDNDIYNEGALKRVYVNAYERNGYARAKCLEHYGYICAVCEFDFENTYGELGKNFIHVHHLISIAKIGKEYQINPKEDLIPVCPNCHAMLHRNSKQEPLTVQELKNILATLKGNLKVGN